jgi:hypothetical protein
LEEYYGSHVNILKKIKRKYDPFSVFNFPQGIVNGEFSVPATAKSENIIINLSDTDEISKKQTDDSSYRGFRYVTI